MSLAKSPAGWATIHDRRPAHRASAPHARPGQALRGSRSARCRAICASRLTRRVRPRPTLPGTSPARGANLLRTVSEGILAVPGQPLPQAARPCRDRRGRPRRADRPRRRRRRPHAVVRCRRLCAASTSSRAGSRSDAAAWSWRRGSRDFDNPLGAAHIAGAERRLAQRRYADHHRPRPQWVLHGGLCLVAKAWDDRPALA